jgi:hypothetical protein
MLHVLAVLRELGESKMSLIIKEVRVVVAGGGVLVAALPLLGVGTVGEELDAAPLEETDPELRSVGKLLLIVQRAAVSGFTPKLNVVGFASVK